MLWNNENTKDEKLTPWVIGAFGIVVFVIATLMNYGGEWFHHASPTDISATTTVKSDTPN